MSQRLEPAGKLLDSAKATVAVLRTETIARPMRSSEFGTEFHLVDQEKSYA